jgi:hypothetical protein
MEQQNFGRVEDLLSQIASVQDDQTTFELWVPGGASSVISVRYGATSAYSSSLTSLG